MCLESPTGKNLLTCVVKNFMAGGSLAIEKRKKSHTHTHAHTRTRKAVQIQTPGQGQPVKSCNNWLRQPPNPCAWNNLSHSRALCLLPTLPPARTREPAREAALPGDGRGPFRTSGDGARLLKQCSIPRKGAAPCAHNTQEVTGGDKV